MKYDELIKDLRICASTFCESCEKCSHSNEHGDCYNGLERSAADAIEELQKQLPKWIPVSERLPEEKCKCLVYKKHTGLSALVSFTNDLESIDKYDFQGQKRWGFFYYDSEYGFCESLGVTHWMPLPEPPKEEADG